MAQSRLAIVRALRTPLLIFVVSRLFVLAVGEVAILLTAPAEDLARTDLHNPLYVWWQRGDVGWYASIVETGYRYDPAQQSSVAFFPSYPAVVWLARLVAGHTTVAGTLVSNAALLLALCVVYSLARERFGARAAAWGTALLAFHPFAFYFSVPFSESLFLLATAGALWLAEHGRWGLACVAAALALATRFVGVALLPALVAPAVGARRIRAGLGRVLALSAAALVAPVSFAAYLWYHFGDPLAFASNNVATWGDPYHVLALVPDRIARLASPEGLRLTEFGTLMVLGNAMLLACLAVTAWSWRALGTRQALFAALAALLPLVTQPSFASGRYTAVVFPVYLAMGALLGGAARVAVLAVFVLGLAWLTVRYVTGAVMW